VACTGRQGFKDATACQRPSFCGSGAIVVMGSVGEQDALAEQVESGAAVHLPFGVS